MTDNENPAGYYASPFEAAATAFANHPSFNAMGISDALAAGAVRKSVSYLNAITGQLAHIHVMEMRCRDPKYAAVMVFEDGFPSEGVGTVFKALRDSSPALPAHAEAQLLTALNGTMPKGKGFNEWLLFTETLVTGGNLRDKTLTKEGRVVLSLVREALMERDEKEVTA